MVSLSAEHGKLQLDESARDLKIGDRLEVIPGYGDLTTVLHDRFHAFRGDRLEAIWPLEAGEFAVTVVRSLRGQNFWYIAAFKSRANDVVTLWLDQLRACLRSPSARGASRPRVSFGRVQDASVARRQSTAIAAWTEGSTVSR